MGILRSDETNMHSPVRATFDSQTGTILLHLDKVEYNFVDHPVRYQGKTYQPVKELLILIVGKDSEIIRKFLESHPDDSVDIQDLVLSTDWSFNQLDEFYYIEQERPAGQAIIQMVEIPGLRDFLKDLSKLVSQGFLLPPTYVNLYTRGLEREIRLPDQHSFQQHIRLTVTPGEVRLAEDRPVQPGADQGFA